MRPRPVRGMAARRAVGRAVACAWGAGVLFVSALAPASFAQTFEPSVIPEAAWWRTEASQPFVESPLAALRGPSMRLEQEWAPLYRSGDTRVETGHRSAQFVTAPRAVRAAVEVSGDATWMHGGDGPWWMALERNARTTGTIVTGWSPSQRFAAAAAVRSDGERSPGVSAETEMLLAPFWTAHAGASQTHERGTLDARWDDTRIAAPGTWIDRRVWASMRAGTADHAASFDLTALNRWPETRLGYDTFQPYLAWRGASVNAVTKLGTSRWEIGAAHADGRQTFHVSRNGTAYGVISGPLASDRGMIGVRPTGGRIVLRVWQERTRATMSGSLALWAFDALVGALGTRRAGSWDGDLDQRGVTIDRTLSGPVGFEQGLALWQARLGGDYRTWQGTFLGLGKEDLVEGTNAPNAVLLGARLAPSFVFGVTRFRVEAIQWVPLRYDDGTPGKTGSGDSGGSEGGPPGGPGTSSRHLSAWGGSIVRLSVETSLR